MGRSMRSRCRPARSESPFRNRDLGLAVDPWDGLTAGPRFPTIDVFYCWPAGFRARKRAT
jgi:hypothetical protein